MKGFQRDESMDERPIGATIFKVGGRCAPQKIPVRLTSID
jgi:hypothetical protein